MRKPVGGWHLLTHHHMWTDAKIVAAAHTQRCITDGQKNKMCGVFSDMNIGVPPTKHRTRIDLYSVVTVHLRVMGNEQPSFSFITCTVQALPR